MKRECRAIRAEMHAYLDGESPAQQAERIPAHVAECAECRESLAAVTEARRLLRSQPQPKVPAGLAAAINARVRQELSRPVRVAFDWRRVAMPAAAAAGLVLAVAYAHLLTRSPETPRVAEAPILVDQVLPVETPSAVAAADAVVVAAADAEATSALGLAPARRRSRSATRDVDPSTEAPAEEVEAADSEPSAAESPPDAPPLPGGEMHLARALATPGAVGDTAIVDIGPADVVAPRITPASDTLRPYEPVAPPTGMADELATGVVARMLVDKFIAEHLIETTPTLMAVAIGTSSDDLGPAVLATRDERFPLCFTNAMRRFLAEAQE